MMTFKEGDIAMLKKPSYGIDLLFKPVKILSVSSGGARVKYISEHPTSRWATKDLIVGGNCSIGFIVELNALIKL